MDRASVTNRKLIIALSILACVSAGCGENSRPPSLPGQQPTRLHVGGSTFLDPMMQRWAKIYEQKTGVQIDYQAVGSGTGLERLQNGAWDFACIDIPLTDQQRKKAEEAHGPILHIPLVLSAVVPVYNLEEAKQPVCFTGPLLADIFLGKIKKWNDPQLQGVNNGIQLPDRDIIPVHYEYPSATTAIFSDFLSRSSRVWKKQVGTGSQIKWPSGRGARGGAGMGTVIAATPGALGYKELPYVLKNDPQHGRVLNKEGRFILPAIRSVREATEAASDDIPEDLRFWITNPPGKESYPICDAAWAIVYVEQPPERAKPTLDFLKWLTHEGQKYAEEGHLASLPEKLVKRCDKLLKHIKKSSINYFQE